MNIKLKNSTSYRSSKHSISLNTNVNTTTEEQICNTITELVALKSFVIEQIYVLKNALKKNEVLSEGSNLVKLLQEEISYLRE